MWDHTYTSLTQARDEAVAEDKAESVCTSASRDGPTVLFIGCGRLTVVAIGKRFYGVTTWPKDEHTA